MPGFCDQAYLRDRDLVVQASSKEEAIGLFIAHYREYWLRPEEFKFVQVLTNNEGGN